MDLGFFKNYHKDIKSICEENEKDFQCWAFLSFKTKSVTQSLLQTYNQKYESFYMHSFSFEYVFTLVCTNF